MINVTGIDNHQVTGLKVVDASAKVMSQKGPVICIMRQYAYHGQHRTIHSSIQMECHGTYVDERSLQAGGRQCIVTLEGYVFPLNIRNGLPYLMMTPNTDEDWDLYPHVMITPGDMWNTKIWDNDLASKEDWYDKIMSVKDDRYNSPFNAKRSIQASSASQGTYAPGACPR